MSSETDIWRDIDVACAEEIPTRREALFESLSQRLRVLVSGSDDADTLYALGYVLYKHPRRMTSTALQDETEATLRRVLTRDPSHALARMYLGYNAYDLGRYDAAKEHFVDADPSRLAPNFALSRDELILSAEIRRDGLAESLPALERYVAMAEAATVYDIFPMTLARTLGELQPALARLDVEQRERVIALARRLDHAGHFTDWFQKLVAWS